MEKRDPATYTVKQARWSVLYYLMWYANNPLFSLSTHPPPDALLEKRVPGKSKYS